MFSLRERATQVPYPSSLRPRLDAVTLPQPQPPPPTLLSSSENLRELARPEKPCSTEPLSIIAPFTLARDGRPPSPSLSVLSATSLHPRPLFGELYQTIGRRPDAPRRNWTRVCPFLLIRARTVARRRQLVLTRRLQLDPGLRPSASTGRAQTQCRSQPPADHSTWHEARRPGSGLTDPPSLTRASQPQLLSGSTWPLICLCPAPSAPLSALPLPCSAMDVPLSFPNPYSTLGYPPPSYPEPTPHQLWLITCYVSTANLIPMNPHSLYPFATEEEELPALIPLWGEVSPDRVIIRLHLTGSRLLFGVCQARFGRRLTCSTTVIPDRDAHGPKCRPAPASRGRPSRSNGGPVLQR